MEDDKKIDPFHPQEPKIPGVPEGAARPPKPSAPPPAVPPKAVLPPPPPPKRKTGEKSEHLPLIWVGSIVAACLVCVIIAWWSHQSKMRDDTSTQTVDVPAPAASPAKAKVDEKLPEGPGPVATTRELEKAWSSKKFTFRNPVTDERVPAMVVRLPGGVLWGFSLREPFGTCEMEYITDLGKIENDYHYRASHPMVVDPCNRAVFDLTDYGSGPNGPVRGSIVSGAAVRPPIAIEMSTKGSDVVADRIE
jgi:hypothetical protein